MDYGRDRCWAGTVDGHMHQWTTIKFQVFDGNKTKCDQKITALKTLKTAIKLMEKVFQLAIQKPDYFYSSI